MAHILIIVGTESGNARMCADHLNDHLPGQGHTVEVVEEAEAGGVDLADRDVVLVCTSTHGDGELPDNLIPLAGRLRAERPDLAHLRYGVIAREEAYLERKFGQPYLDYKSKVRRWL